MALLARSSTRKPFLGADIAHSRVTWRGVGAVVLDGSTDRDRPAAKSRQFALAGHRNRAYIIGGESPAKEDSLE